MDITSVIGNNSWEFYDHTMMGTKWNRWHTLKFHGWPRKTIGPLYMYIYMLHTLKFHGWPRKTIGPLYRYKYIYMLHQALCVISNPLVNSNRSYSPKTLNSDQNLRFLYHVTLKFDGWSCKTIGHLFCATSVFVHHYIAISEIKLDLRSGNAQIGTKLVLISNTLTFDLDILHGHHFCQW